MRFKHLVRTVAALLAIVVYGSCTPDANPTAPPENPSYLLGGVIEETTTTIQRAAEGLLTCQPLPISTASATIGPRGGKLEIGPHVLEIPRGALSSSVRITGTTLGGNIRAVEFEPHGLTFERSSELTMSYAGCEGIDAPKKIAYVDNHLNILEYLRSKDNGRREQVSGKLDHFSSYAVAW